VTTPPAHRVTFESDRNGFPGSPYAAVVLDGEQVGVVKYSGKVALVQCYLARFAGGPDHEIPLFFESDDEVRTHILVEVGN
jgi:hypothetical protein